MTAQLRERIVGPGSAEVWLLPPLHLLEPSSERGVLQIIERIRHVATSIKDLPPATQIAARTSYRNALHGVFGLNLGIAVLCLLCTLPLREYALPSSFAEEEENRRQRNGGNTPSSEEEVAGS